MQRAAAATLPSFDTGYWTYYSLPREASPLDYQQYVVQLLKKLAPTDPRFADAAAQVRRLPAPAARVPARERLARDIALLAVEARDGAGEHRRRPDEAARTRRRVAHPRVARAEAAGPLSGARQRGRLGREPRLVRRPADRARDGRRDRDRCETNCRVDEVGGYRVAVGAALDDLSQAGALQKLGLRLARIGVTWPAGAPTPDPTVTTALQSLPAGLGSVLELNASPLPADDAGRAALAQYAATLAQQTPGLQSLVLAPAPTTATAGAYALAYDDIRAALLDAAPDVQVGIRIDGALAPKATLTALGAVLPQLVAFHPAPAPGNGLWTTTDVTKLITALTASAGTAPPVLLDGPPAPTAALISSLGCGNQVAGILLDQLSQATAPLLAAAASARRGALVCPGVATQVQATGVTYPTAATAPLSVQFGCDVDCLYLLTLDGPNGRPVVARRGALHGGGAPATIALPSAKLGAGPYRVGIHLVASVNPGPMTALESPPLG